jgi:hypothetical protein
MATAQERGSTVLEESELLQKVGCPAEVVEDWLADYWVEHDIHAVASGQERTYEKTLSLVRQCDRYFQVRLFSPSEKALREWPSEELGNYCSLGPQLVRPRAALGSGRRERRLVAELHRVGVSILCYDGLRLQCGKCHAEWSPNSLPGGRLPRGYNRCPNGCNGSAAHKGASH